MLRLCLRISRGHLLLAGLSIQEIALLTPLCPLSSFDLVRSSQFIVFDSVRGLDILGNAPSYEFMFNTRNDSVHEAPVYVPALNSIIYFLSHKGIFEQQIINLKGSQPTLSNYTTNATCICCQWRQTLQWFCLLSSRSWNHIPFSNNWKDYPAKARHLPPRSSKRPSRDLAQRLLRRAVQSIQ